MISVIMPSYLGAYRNAADNREYKLRIAIESVINQTYSDLELIIIADGCDKTVEIGKEYIKDERIRILKIVKQPMFSGTVRNTGLKYAKGDIVCYLDSDDYFGKNHLQIIADNIRNNVWIFFNDIIFRGKQFQPRQCTLHLGKCGTSNIAHANIPIEWNKLNTYGHDDWAFIRKLMVYPYANIGQAEYYVTHIPGKGGYQI